MTRQLAFLQVCGRNNTSMTFWCVFFFWCVIKYVYFGVCACFGVCVQVAGETSLHIAIANKNMQLVEYLLKNGADVDAQVHILVKCTGPYSQACRCTSCTCTGPYSRLALFSFVKGLRKLLSSQDLLQVSRH
jgi:hypothetical protein